MSRERVERMQSASSRPTPAVGNIQANFLFECSVNIIYLALRQNVSLNYALFVASEGNFPCKHSTLDSPRSSALPWTAQ
jgi:hypothetical protein